MSKNQNDTSEYVSIGFLVVKEGARSNKNEEREGSTEPHFINENAHQRFIDNIFSLNKEDENDLQEVEQ